MAVSADGPGGDFGLAREGQRRRAAVLLELSRREREASDSRPRVPEPMALSRPASVDAFDAAGAEHGPMLPLYEVCARSVAALLPRSGLVLDLGCGSGRSAVHLAMRRPDARILGVDLSEPMVRAGRHLVRSAGLEGRVELRLGDFCDLRSFRSSHPAVIAANLSLHHLPSVASLEQCLSGIAALQARTGASVWILDLARLRDPTGYRDLLDTTPSIARALRAEALSSEASAWTFEELSHALQRAGIACSSRLLAPFPLFQSHWRAGSELVTEPILAGWRETYLPSWTVSEAAAIARQLGVPVRQARSGMPERSIDGPRAE
jgi:SAM-dependent methyltransferase